MVLIHWQNGLALIFTFTAILAALIRHSSIFLVAYDGAFQLHQLSEITQAKYSSAGWLA